MSRIVFSHTRRCRQFFESLRVRVAECALGTITLLAAALVAAPIDATAQPTRDPDPLLKSVSEYVYLVNSKGDKILLNTQFWRNDAGYDDRAQHRFFEVMSALEKRGFHKDANATIDNWDDPRPFVRCYIYMEDLQAARSAGRGPMISGTRLQCVDNGASEFSVRASDSPQHVKEILQHFDIYFARAEKKVHKQ